ncbi:MAG: AI-2E family transporter [Candidatus Liberibacter ctenarytainae]|uniref:AI-2E family transporter n=1 Tax=Candidatus Liberibacter ctenarytainae TaxID=2020335 RepID=A0A937ACP1_9HYPH|nr:AI-2E family transporter [Candidatus Liberibacter ctenarytainae]
MKESVLRPNRMTSWAIIIIGLLSLYFLKGFFVPVFAALIIGFTTWPIYKLFLTEKKKEESSTLLAVYATLSVIILFIIPISFFAYYARLEIQNLASYIISANAKGIPIPHWLSKIPSLSWLEKLWSEHISKPQGLTILAEMFLKKNGIQFVQNFIFYVSSSIIEYILSVIFMIVALFFIYRDGSPLSRQLNVLGNHLLPTYWQKISRIIPIIVRSTFLGLTIIALGEGVVLGAAYYLAGISSYFMLGMITAIMALIPGGAPTSFVLVSLYLVTQDHLFNAICLVSWGTIELFIVDKTLRPFLVGGSVKLPFLPTFFGLVGGVRTMGLLGLFIGPVLMVLLTTIWKESFRAVQEERSQNTPDDA